MIRFRPGGHALRRSLWLCFLVGLMTAVAGCGGKARAQTDPPLIQPTPDPTMDAVVRGLVTIVVPTATGAAGRATLQPMTQSQPQTDATAAPARPATVTVIVSTPPTAIAVTATLQVARLSPPTSTIVERAATPTAVPTPVERNNVGGTPTAAAPTPLPAPDGRAVPVTPVTSFSRSGTQ